MITARQKKYLDAVMPGFGAIIQNLQKGSGLALEGYDLTANTGCAALDTCEALNMDTEDDEDTFTAELDTAYFVKGTKSVKLKSIVTDAIGDDKIYNAITSEDWSDTDVIGFWAYSDKALSAGDLKFYVKSTAAGDQVVNVPALSAGEAKFCEISISGLTKNDVARYGFQRNKAAIFNVNIDTIYRLKSTMRITLAQTPLFETVKALAVVKANTGAHTFAALTSDTDFVVANDGKHVYFLTDQSTKTGVFQYAY